MLSVELIIYIFFVYILAGFVKGVVGVGLPTISLALLAIFLGMKEAMLILLAPSLITNIVQALAGGRLYELTKRLWIFLLSLFLLTWFSTGVLVASDGNLLKIGLGIILLLYCASYFSQHKIPKPGKKEKWLNPLMGGLTGVTTGLTGTFVVPAVLYLQRMGVKPKCTCAGNGVIWQCGNNFLRSFSWRKRCFNELLFISSSMVIPALIGMALGNIISQKLMRIYLDNYSFSHCLQLEWG